MSDGLSPGNAVRRFARSIVIVFGLLFLAFGGLRSAVFLRSFFAEGDLINLVYALTIGVPAALMGGLVISRGPKLWVRR